MYPNSNIKIRGGTRADNVDLCTTCSHSLIRKGSAESCEVVYCGYNSKTVTFKVVECNRYYKEGQTSLSDFYKTAWILETSKSDRNIGFIPYKDWRLTHKDEVDNLD